MLYRFLRFCGLVLTRLFFHFEVRGRENIPKVGGFILASNHVSYIDPTVLGFACSRRLTFMAKEELFRNPLFSWFLFKVEAFPIKRNSADIAALKEAMRRIKKGKALVLFPEGRRSDTKATFSQPSAGVSFLAEKLNVPVIPAFIKGTEKALPKGAKFIRLAKISVYFGKQIQTERGAPYQSTAQMIMAKIRHLSC